VGCTWEWEWDLRGGGMRKTVWGGGNGNDRTLAEHGMTAGNGNGLCGEGGMGMAEHGMAVYPLPP
jgi:hypothetical protein